MHPPSTAKAGRRGFLVDALVAVGLVFALYGDSLASRWSYDDTIILSTTITRAPFRYLTVPEAWQAFNWRGFYPLYLVSFDLEYRVFGLSPVAFRVYQLALAASAAFLLGRLLRRLGCDGTTARAAMAVFLLGPAVGTVAEQMMTRCFLEGTGLLLASAWALAAALSREPPPLPWAAAGLWLLAALEKEVFVPFLLPFALFALMRAVKTLVPWCVAAAAYVSYRLYLAPYGVRVYDVDALSPHSLLAHASQLAHRLAAAIFPAASPGGALLLLGLLSTAAVLSPRSVRAWALVAATAAASLGPVLLVSEVLSERHVLVIWIALVCWLAVGVAGRLHGGARAWSTLAAAALLLALSSFLLLWNRAHWAGLRSDAEWYDDVGRLLFETAGSKDVVVSDPASVHYPFVAGLDVLRERNGDGAEIPFFITDEAALCRMKFAPGTQFWDVRGKRIRLTPGLPARIGRETCPRIHTDGPLAVRLRKRGGLLEWELGPYPSGTYSLVFLEPDKRFGGPVIRYGIPRKGGVWIHEEDRSTAFYISHVGEDGGIVQSPDLRLRLRGDSEIRWER